MTAAPRVHALLAAALADPALVARWSADPGQAPEGLDVTGLRRFAGFVTMVRHNPVRRVLPLTFQALAVADAQVEAFAAYAPAFTRRAAAGGFDLGERVASFAAFLCEWLDPELAAHVVVRDLLVHELALDSARRGAAAPAPCVAPASDVPSVDGAAVVRRLAFDPRLVSAALAAGDDPAAVAPGEHLLCYWCASGSADVRVVAVTPLGAYLVSAVDGVSTVGEIAARLAADTGVAVEPGDVLDALRDLGGGALVTFGAAAPCG